jgi:CBS domain-containing protein
LAQPNIADPHAGQVDSGPLMSRAMVFPDFTPGRYGCAVILSELMTQNVVTALAADDVLTVAQLMRDHNVGSVVICDSEGVPVAMVTDRDLAVRVVAEPYLSRPIVTGEPEMDVTEAAAEMVQHGIRRLPVVNGGRLVGIVTLDDLAVRTGNLEMAQRMTHEVIEGAMPEFFFRDRG